MDISVIISKSIAYGLTMIILGLFYFAFAIPYRYFVSPNIDIGFLSMTVAYGVFVGFAFERLRMFIQTSSDKLFLKGKYDFTDTIAYFSEKLSYVAGMEDLKAVLEEARVEKMELKMLDVRQKGDLSGKEAEYYSKNKKPAVFDELPEELKDEEKKKDIEYIVPCLFKGELISLLYVGKKLSEDAFRDEELDALKVIAPQIAVVIERIKPYERVKVDLATEQEKVKIAQKAAEDNARLAALGTLAAGLAHEIRNPMTVLRSKSETVLERIDDKEYVSNYARMMPEQIDRILSIINRMLKFAKAKSEEMETTDINKVIEDTLSMLEGRIKDKSIKVEKELDAKNKIMANPVMLSEAFFNIMQNSLDFTGKDGVLKARSFDSENNVEIEIADTGSGMTKEQVDHIFEPFYTTRAEGTGLGLSIAHRNIIDHKGKIEVSSQIGKGTAFKMTFPSI
ncbi:MAG: ATP-binding protein [Candidatus Saganbacteria bacterium]|nr:ATP-binding protein [Candidatus Saganbacteria bacterium]